MGFRRLKGFYAIIGVKLFFGAMVERNTNSCFISLLLISVEFLMRTVARITKWSKMFFLQMIFEGFLGEQTMH